MTKNDFEKALHETLDFSIYIGDSICSRHVDISSEVFQLKLDISEVKIQEMTPGYTIPAGTLSMVDVIGRYMGASEMMHPCPMGCCRV